ncbi:MAG: hypothetical protein Q8922_05390 [Bacteroidota bacterium]|nr:hypothetical protein [Bacteroidota bacterium]MDP4233164.1 hypothetical protein [Bacteroidota bacterium]MDP4241691.1 hypothetical protein [Bacteroidota bacterium]MDP4287349.1 hypothetical protein [Bacteroidota bacterium]
MREVRSLPLLRNLPREAQLFAALIMLVLGVGYAHALAYVYQTTRMIPAGIEERYRGTESQAASASNTSPSSELSSEEAEDTTQTIQSASKTGTGEIEYQKSLAEMLNIIHTHILTMTFIFALSGFITLMTDSLNSQLRKLIVLEPFIGILITFAGLWLMRYVHPAFSWLVSLSGTVMALAFAGQCLALIRELRTR